MPKSKKANAARLAEFQARKASSGSPYPTTAAAPTGTPTSSAAPSPIAAPTPTPTPAGLGPASLPPRPYWVPTTTTETKTKTTLPLPEPEPEPASEPATAPDAVAEPVPEQPEPERKTAPTLQRQSQRLTSSSGGEEEVRSETANNRAQVLSETANPATPNPATGRGLPSTGSLATTPVGPSGGHQHHDVEPSFNYYVEEDQYLITCGWRPCVEMHNGKIEQRYGKCSKEHHRLKMLLDFETRRSMQEEIMLWQNQPAMGPHGCRPKSGITRTIRYRCPDCNDNSAIVLSRERVLAEFSEPVDTAWKAVVKTPNGQLVYHASARCCLYQGSRHCITYGHVRLETKRHNDTRAQHHAGRAGCWCPQRCLDERVILRDITRREVAQGQRVGVASGSAFDRQRQLHARLDNRTTGAQQPARSIRSR